MTLSLVPFSLSETYVSQKEIYIENILWITQHLPSLEVLTGIPQLTQCYVSVALHLKSLLCHQKMHIIGMLNKTITRPFVGYAVYVSRAEDSRGRPHHLDRRAE